MRASLVMVLLRFKVSRSSYKSLQAEFYDCVVKVPSYCYDVLYLIFIDFILQFYRFIYTLFVNYRFKSFLKD